MGPTPGSHHVQVQRKGEEWTEASESLCWGCHSHGSHLEAISPNPMLPSDEITALGCNLNGGLSSAFLPMSHLVYRENMDEGAPPHAQHPAAPKVWLGQVSS